LRLRGFKEYLLCEEYMVDWDDCIRLAFGILA
jgi:hypothetical protein